MRMEDRNRSGSHSGGGVVKNRSSSGCLIIKKKPEEIGLVGCSSRENNISNNKKKKEKKRARLATPAGSESVSSDEELLEFYRMLGGGPPPAPPAPPPVPPLVYKRGVGNHGGEFSSKINDFDDVGFGSKLDVYDFDEYDDLSDVERIGMRGYCGREIGLGGDDSETRFMNSRGLGMGIKSGLDFEGGSSKGGDGDIIYRRRNSFNGSMSEEKFKGSGGGGDRRSVKRRFEVKNEVRGISMGKDKFGGSNEAIRLQGKNGVLKVMVKHKKENNAACMKPQSYVQVEGSGLVPRPQEMSSKNVVIRSSPYSDRRLQKKPMVIGWVEKDRERKQKSVSAKSSEQSDEESEDSDTSPKLQSDSAEAHRPVKRGRNGGNVRSPEITPQPVKLKEGKVKRGSGTEKQKLREKIRNMLVSAGWTIDYRPRRGRDYFDAVYVNPAGTAYWSIIKAYDALQKQLEEEGNCLKLGGDDSSSFAPISDDILSKLTRQTRKKIEKELKRKKREEGRGKRKKELTSRNFEEEDSDTYSTGSGRHDDKLSSFMKRSGKSLKGGSKETYSRGGTSPSSRMQERGEKSSFMSNSRFIHGRKSKKIGRCTLLIRSSEKGVDSDSDGFVPYTGKRNLLSWLIDSGTVKLSEKVHYMNRRRTRIMLEGWITREGIHCGCCSKILSISKFEIHAASKLRQQFQNIYLSSGVSLMQCQVDAWNRQDECQRKGFCEIDVDGNDPNDDTCAICGDGGNLICCDGCPSTFHQNCLNIRMLPPGDWHCPHCSCKFCGLADVSTSERNDLTKATVLTCNLCEGKYHSSCMEEKLVTSANSNNAASFCGKRCQELFEHLQKILGVRYELEAGLCWSLIHRTDLDSDINGRGYPLRVEWNSKLAVALTVMDECFLPIIDRRSGINMIHNVLYNCGSNFTRLNYSGFYTAVLERGDEIVSAASIRIRGTQFAEMPFIGTRHIYRRQGMCRRLFSAIESALRSLKVEKLIIPAISELMDTWTGVFGFSALGDNDKQEMKTLNMLAFPGTDMLQKKLLDEDNMKNDFAGPTSVDAVPDDNGMNEKSDMDLDCQDAVASVEETSLHNTPGVCIKTKPLDSACAVNEVKPLVSSEGSQGTTSSALQVDTKLNEVGDVKVHDSLAKHDIEAPADCKLMEEASIVDADTAMPPANISVDGTTYSLLDGSLGNDDHVLTDHALCSKKGSTANSGHHSLVDSFHDDVVAVKPMIESPAQGNIQEPLEVDVDGTHEVPTKITNVCCSPQTIILLTTPVDGMCNSSENAIHGAVVQGSPQLDSCNENSNEKILEAPHTQKITVGGMCKSPENVSHGAVVEGAPLPDFCNEDSDENILEAPHTQKITVGIDQQHDSCDAISSQVNSEGKEHQSHGISVEVAGTQPVRNDGFEATTQNVGTSKLEVSQLDSCGGGSDQPNSESEIHHVGDSTEVACVQPVGNIPCEISGQSNGAVVIERRQPDSCEDSKPISEGKGYEISDEGAKDQPVSETSSQNDGDVGIEKLQHDSCEGGDQPISEGKVHEISERAKDQPVSGTFCENDGDVGIEKLQDDSCECGDQPILEGKVHEIRAEGANDQILGKFEVSAHTDTSEHHPSLSTDGGTGETVLLPVTNPDAI